MKEVNNDIILSLNNSLEIELPEKISYEELRKKLAGHINYLIENDFQKLVSILYRIDISEKKLKLLLKDNTDVDAGSIIAELIIVRQLEKIKYRQQFKQRDNNIDENDKW